MICTHPSTSLGSHYECCLECGATRKRWVPNRPQDTWHTCEICIWGPYTVSNSVAPSRKKP